ncbi:MAG TPA: glycosyltransferase [Solirubrobacteraceae bacterium]|nr:glycosyltransferase [Solirubrobacteraceae bacterium]
MTGAADLSVVVPVRNAERLVGDCLASVERQAPREIIVVDGRSTDATVEIARRHRGVRVLSDDGRGVAVARLVGAQAATSRWVALVDADVLLGDGDLERLLAEFRRGGYTALQAGLESESGDGYWGRALADHHRSGRSRHWFGLVATIVDRDAFLRYGVDARFTSGEDVDLRWRLRSGGARIGVSRATVVRHRFDDTWDFARGQFLADGHGLGRMVALRGPRATALALLPLAAGIRGVLLSVARGQPRWIPYYAAFVVFNYVGIVREVARATHARVAPRQPARA